MLNGYGFRLALTTGTLLAMLLSSAVADDASGQAAPPLQQALTHYNDLDFSQAKALLLGIDPQALSDTDRAARARHLAIVDGAIRGQAAGNEALSSGIAAAKAGDTTRARALLQKAADNPYLPPAQRQQAHRAMARLPQNPVIDAPQKPAIVAPAPTNPNQEQAAHLLQKARIALDQNRPDEARTLLLQARKLDPASQDIKRNLAFAEGLLGIETQGAALTELQRRHRVARQLNDLEIEKALRHSNEVLAQAKTVDDFRAASNAAQAAMDVLVTRKELYTQKEYLDRVAAIEKQLQFIQVSQDQWNKRRLAATQSQMRTIEADQLRMRQQQHREKVQTLIARATTLMRDRNYKAALEEVDRILQLEPQHRWAGEQREDLAQMILLAEEKDAVNTRDRQTSRVLVENKRSEIPWWKELQYPKDWLAISERRKGAAVAAGQESEANRRVRARLKERIKELNFDQIELKDVIQFLRDVSGVNIYVRWSVLNAVGISRSTPVNVRLTDVSLETALRIILEDVGASALLGYVLDEGVITISTRDDLSTRTVTRVYDIRDLIIRPPSFVGPRLGTGSDNGTDNGSGNGISSTNVGGITGGGEDLLGEDSISQEEIVNGIIEMVKATIAPDSWQDVNRTGIQELRGQLVIAQTVENHEQIVELLGRLREARALQVSIECRFIQVQNSFLERIGVEASLTINNEGHFSHLTNPLTIGGAEIAWAHATGATTIGLDLGAAVIPSALNIANTFLDDFQVDFIIQATQANALARVLTAPRLTLFNGQRSYILVEQNTTYLREFTLTREVVDPNTAETRQVIEPTTDQLRTGTMLDLQATVSDDRRYVTLTVRPQIVTGTTRQLTLIDFDDEQGNQVLQAIELPNTLTSEMETTVSVPDGGTLLIGGLKQGGQRERELGVPVLSRIPIINRLVTNRGMGRDDDILLILIKPKIIIQSEEEELAYP